MKRRTFLTSASLVGTGALAGCLDSFGLKTQSAWRSPPLVDNRPNAVYYPMVVEGMGMYGMSGMSGMSGHHGMGNMSNMSSHHGMHANSSGTMSGMNSMRDEFAVALMYTYPHRFWTVTGDQKNKVVVKSDDSLHLMASVWHRKTGTVLPTPISMEILQDGETVDRRSPWPMLSPSMGFHYGDNVSLDGEGKYTARLSLGPMGIDRIGALAGTLTETQTVEIPFEFDTNEVYSLPLKRFGEKAGTIGAPALMEMKMDIPRGVVAPKDEFPGRVIGMATHGKGHAEFVVSVFDGPRFGTNSPYLAVSARTPFNRIILPLMSVSATLTRNGKTVFDGPLGGAVDPQMSYHYGTALDSLESGDELTISVQTPPQTAYHDGYETAFMDIPKLRMTV